MDYLSQAHEEYFFKLLRKTIHQYNTVQLYGKDEVKDVFSKRETDVHMYVRKYVRIHLCKNNRVHNLPSLYDNTVLIRTTQLKKTLKDVDKTQITITGTLPIY